MSGENEFKVWWIPQAPMTAFEVDVPDLETGVLLCNVLARYDAFQFEHKVKPDYCNVGGIRWRGPETSGEWYDVDPDDEDDMVDVRARIGGSL